MAQETQLSKLMPDVLPDPLLTSRWIAKVVPIITFEGATHSLPSEYIESIELPFNNVTSSGVFIGGGHWYFPEFHDVSAVNINFYGDSRGNSLRYLWAWKRLVKRFDNGLYRLPVEYKQDWTIALLDPKGDIVIEGYLKGTWPADTQSVALNYTDGTSRIVYSQNFSLDDMDLKVR